MFPTPPLITILPFLTVTFALVLLVSAEGFSQTRAANSEANKDHPNTSVIVPAARGSQTPPSRISSLTKRPHKVITITRLQRDAGSAQFADLCSSGSIVTAYYGNASGAFSLDQPSCVTVKDIGSDCCVGPYEGDCCWFGIINSQGQPDWQEQTKCGPPGTNEWTFCLDPGDYILSVDVCQGGVFSVECDSQKSCPLCQ